MEEVLRTVAVWFLVALVYSIGGWLMEFIICMFQRHKVVNRGFLIGPVCPIYGIGVIIATLLLRDVNNIFVIFFVSFIGGGLLEYISSYVMEKIFHVRWWDYSDIAFNLNGRICFIVLVGFGVAGIIILKVLNPLLFAFFTSLSAPVLLTVAIILAVILILDLIISLILILGFRVTVGTAQVDATEEISERVRELIMEKSILSRRLAKAFPNFQPKQPTRKPRKSHKPRKSTKTKRK